MKLLIFICVFLFHAILFSEENPDIYLPQVILEVEDTGVRKLDIPDPQVYEAAAALPGILMDIGTADSLIPALGELPIIDPLTSDTAPAEDRRFFAEGTIGAGSGNRIYGNIELTQLNKSGPGFTVGFLHDSRDGYLPFEPGQGYSDRTTRIYGSAVVIGDPFEFFTEGALSEKAWGFQGNADFIDVTNRQGTLQMEGIYRNKWFAAKTDLKGTYIGQVFGSVEPRTHDYYRFVPRLDMSVNRETFNAGLYGMGLFTADTSWEFGAFGEFRPRPWIGVSGEFGVIGPEYGFPWQAELDFGYFDSWLVRINAGRYLDSITADDVLALAPFSPLLNQYPFDSYWYVGTEAIITSANFLSMTLSARIFRDREFFWLDNELDDQGLLPFSEQMYTMEYGGFFSAGLRYAPQLHWYLSASWIYDYYPIEIFGSRHYLDLQAEYSFRNQGLQLRSSVKVPFNEGQYLPDIGFSLDYPLGEHVSLMLYASDLLGMFREDGREYIGPYRRKGFELSFFTKISL